MASLTGDVKGTRVVAHSDGTFSVSNNQPLSGATVTAVIVGGTYTQTTTTGSEGNYTLKNIEVGIYDVTANLQGWESSTKAKVLVSRTGENTIGASAP